MGVGIPYTSKVFDNFLVEHGIKNNDWTCEQFAKEYDENLNDLNSLSDDIKYGIMAIEYSEEGKYMRPWLFRGKVYTI